MRLYKRGKTYYVEIKRGVSRSLKTGDKRTAQSLFNEIKQELLHKNIEFMSKKESYKISEFQKLYKTHPDRINLYPHSHRADHTAIKSFMDSNGDINLTEITAKHIVKFKSDCQSRGLTANAINTYLRHLSACFNFAKKEGLMPTPPEITKLKTPTKLIRVISPDDIQKILTYSKDHEPEMYRIIFFEM